MDRIGTCRGLGATRGAKTRAWAPRSFATPSNGATARVCQPISSRRIRGTSRCTCATASSRWVRFGLARRRPWCPCFDYRGEHCRCRPKVRVGGESYGWQATRRLSKILRAGEFMRQRAFVLVSVFAGMAGAVVLSAQVTTKFKADHARLQTAARNLAIQKGLSEAELLRNAISSPFKGRVSTVQKVLPGGSISVTVTGDFPAGTTFLSERDAVMISGATQTTTSYSARLTIPQDEAPGYVRLFAITPVGIEGFAAVALVDTFYRFDLKSPDGYTVKITPLEKTFTIDNVHASAKYQAEFYKLGQTTPFQTVTGDQSFDPGKGPFESHTPYARIDIGFDQSAGAPEAELEALKTQED